MKGTRDAKVMEERRRQAVELHKQGWNQYEIAEALGVKQPSVSRWLWAEATGGPDALKSKPLPGMKSKLTAQQKEELIFRLRESPCCHGFEGGLWTSPMVTELIRMRFGVRYHPGNVRKLLRQLGFSPQRPVKRAIQRDEEAIEKWCRETWPSIKKTPHVGGRR
jgi:transposase